MLISYCQSAGEKLLYRKLYIIKQSQQSTVWLCEDENGGNAVCKKVNCSPGIYEKLKEAECTCVPQIYEINELSSDNTHRYIEIFEEYIEGMTLQEIPLSYKEALSVTLQLCRAVEEIHSLGIVHRDIKPSNIMLDGNGNLKIVDFSSARFFKQEMDKDTICLGTQGFAAPEQYGYAQTDYRSDIFAIGQTLRLIFENNIKFPVGYIIDRCTCFDPDKRFRNCRQIIFLLKFAGLIKPFATVFVAAVLLTAAVSVIGSSGITDNTVPVSADTANEMKGQTYPTNITAEEITNVMTSSLTETSLEISNTVSETTVFTEKSDLSGTASMLQETSEITAAQSSGQMTEPTATASETDVREPENPFAEYMRFYKNLDINKAYRLTDEEMDEPLLFKAADGIPMEYIIMDTESLRENKYATMLFDYNGDGYDDLFQLSAYNPEGHDEYFRRLCVSVVKMYDGYPDYKVISDNTYFTSLISTSAMNQETGMLNDGQYVQLSVLDINSDGYNDIVLSVGRCGNIINTQVFYYNNVDFEYSRSGKLNLYLYCTGQMICQGSDRFFVSDNGNTPTAEKRIFSLTLEDTIEAFKYVDPNIFMYEKEDDSMYQKFQGITSR